MREGVMAFSSSFGRLSWPSDGKKEVALVAPGSSTHVLLCPNEEDKCILCKKPPGQRRFLGEGGFSSCEYLALFVNRNLFYDFKKLTRASLIISNGSEMFYFDSFK
jgi:hypothetical protein